MAKKEKKGKKVIDVELKSRLGISDDGNVLLQFNQKIDIVILSPDHAIGIAKGLIQCAEVAKSKLNSGKLFDSSGGVIEKGN